MSASRIARVVGESAKKLVRVEWENGVHSAYSMAWLRDNCRCPKCFHPQAKNRLNLMKDLPLENLSTKKLLPTGSLLEIEWQDGHSSPFTADWLRSRDVQNVRERIHQMAPKRKLWGLKELEEMGGIPEFRYEDLISSKAVLKEWIEALRTVGLAMLEGCPLEEGPCDRVADRIGFWKTTHYGAHWSIKYRPDPNNVAYSGNAIGLHTDLSYYQTPPGVGLFHCIHQIEGSGGESEFCDGFHVLQVLRDEDPAAYDVLDSTRLAFWDFGGEHYAEETGLDATFLKRRLAKTIERDDDGNIFRINFNNQGRDSFLPLDPEKAQVLYDALKKLNDIAYRPENVTIFKMQPGQMIAFDNYRAFHGRQSFEIPEDTNQERHFHGGYLDWDEVSSRYNRLTKSQFQKDF